MVTVSESELPAFNSGAEWVRADFHLHTIKDPGKSRKFREEFAGRENDFVKDWVEQLTSETVGVGVVTNHNFFDRDEYKALRKRAASEGILVLPGVELGVKEGAGGIHTLIVFDPEGWVFNDQNDDRIARFIGSQFTGIPDEGSRTSDDLCGCLEALDSYGHDYFVVFAHVHSDNGLLEELDGSNLGHVIERCGKRWRERVLGLQKVKRPDVVSSRWPASVPIPAFVEGSDPKEIADVGKSDRPCFLKIGELSFESVKFALHDWRQRVSLENPVGKQQPRLYRISFTGGLLNGQSFPLSDQLTCLIGSRGSGKSSVVESLRYGLGMEAGDSDLKYKNGLISAMLGNGGEVSISGITADGAAFEVRRPLGYDPIVSLEGEATRLRPVDILPELLYFGQKDLGHRHPGFEDELFAKLVGRRSVEDRTTEENRIAAVKRAVEEWRSVLHASAKEQEYAQEEERLRYKLSAFPDDIEQQLKQLTQFDADKRSLAEFIGQLHQVPTRHEAMSADCVEIAKEWPEFKSALLVEEAQALAEAKNEFGEICSEYTQLLEKLNQLMAKLRATLKAIQEKERDRQEEFSALQRENDAPGLDLTEFRALKSRHEQLVKLLKAAGNRKAMAAESLANVEAAAIALHDLWRGWHRDEHKQLALKSASTPSEIDLSITFEGNREEFQDFLKAKFSGTGFRTTSLEKIVEQFANGLVTFQRRSEIDNLLGGGADVQKFHGLLEQHLADILTFRVPDRRMVTFNGNPIQDLSLGQRATALLQLLMSLEDHPIFLIDQPEDDLDNETIFRHVVEPLLNAKNRSQFVIATHNPNIPVLGDAELVHACREFAKGEYRHTSGSLDSSATRQSIVSIMEGGVQAFEQRQKIYSQWTNSL